MLELHRVGRWDVKISTLVRKDGFQTKARIAMGRQVGYQTNARMTMGYTGGMSYQG